MKILFEKIRTNTLATYGLLKIVRQSRKNTLSFEFPLCLSERDIDKWVETLEMGGEFSYKKDVYSWCCIGPVNSFPGTCETYVTVWVNFKEGVLKVKGQYTHRPRQRVESNLKNTFECEITLDEKDTLTLIEQLTKK